MKNKIIQISIFTILMALLTSCNSNFDINKNRNTNSNTFFLSSETQGICEKQIRDKIEKKQIELLPESKFKTNIDESNLLLKEQASEESYSFNEINGQIQEIKKTHVYHENSKKKEISLLLGVNDKKSAHAMYFEIKSEQFSENEKVELSQRYSVSTDCLLSLKRTDLVRLTKSNENQIKYEILTIADSEIIDEKTTLFTIPPGKTSVDFKSMSKPTEVLQMLKNLESPILLIPSLGFLDLIIKDLPDEEQIAFGATFKFIRKKIELSYEGKTVVNLIISNDHAKNAQLSVTLSDNKKTWTLSREFTDKINLGQAQLGSSYFDSRLTAEYQNSNGEYILKTNKALSYKGFSAYYQSTLLDEQGGHSKYSLVETYPPVGLGERLPADLEFNSTIQSDLPEIQKIAQDIAAATKVRKEQIAGILKYLSANYSYDYDMLEKEKVRALTTKEALDRKKGVCQHYAVIFTAIARALKIPTRIVVGYMIQAEKPGMHAWVESEIQDNLWQVIEPQSVDGLTTTRTRFYFPLLRGYFLENMDATSTDYIMTLLNSKYTAEPAQ